MFTEKEVKSIFIDVCREAGVEVKVPVHVNSRLTKTLGRVCFHGDILQYSATKVEFSKRFIENATRESVISVIQHEAAHYIAFCRTNESHGHDDYFKSICREIGCSNDGVSTTVEYNDKEVPHYKYELYCPHCEEKLPGGYDRMCKTLREVDLCICPSCKRHSLKVIQNW